MSRSLTIALTVFAALSLAPSVRAQSSGLGFVQMKRSGVGGVVGMDGPQGVFVSPDGRNVYVASYDNTLVVFARDPGDGTLTYLETHVDGVNGVNGLAGAQSVVVSPDDKHVYVAGGEDNAIAVFERIADGRLTFVEFKKDGVGGVDGLHGAETVTISPDGKFIYVASDIDDAVAVFKRDATTGQLTFVEAQKDGVGGVDGLDKARAVVVSPDGKHVYAAGAFDDAVVVFARNASTGKLTFVELKKDGSGGVDGLARARGVAVSPDGRTVYVAGGDDNALAIFTRNASTGKLTFVGVVRDGVDGVDGLAGVQDVIVSTDGERVYAVSETDDTLAVFARDPSTGLLTFVELFRDNDGSVDGLDGAHGLAVSADGRNIYTVSVLDDACDVFGSGLCGNGTVDAGEECDDGNAHSGDCCSASCQSEGEGSPCEDGDFCTDGDVCVAGVCESGPSRDCSDAGDACNDGVCDESSNSCVAQPKADGGSCDDGDACTQSDTCVAGVCSGGDPIVCDDQCSMGGGACDPLTGLCGGTPKPDGTPCDDDDACTQTDTCVAGTCSGGDPVVCGDVCSSNGTCDPATGLCSGTAQPDGTSCDDGNACTQSDSCSGGVCTGSPVQCEATACREAGTCDPSTGLCNGAVKPGGTSCDDGDPCTTGDACENDTCKGTPAGDRDDDGFCDPIDLCPDVWNPDQWDMNHDGVGDMCQCDLPAPGRCVRGGGKKRNDCLLEFNHPGGITFNKKKTRVKNIIWCRDGDAGCDLDGKADGRCTFGVSICLGNQDEMLPKCEPTQVSTLEVVSPNPAKAKPGLSLDNALALERGLVAVGLRVERRGQVIAGTGTMRGPNYCSPLVKLVTPAPTGDKPVRRKFRIRGIGHDGRKDGDRFVLRCTR